MSGGVHREWKRLQWYVYENTLFQNLTSFIYFGLNLHVQAYLFSTIDPLKVS